MGEGVSGVGWGSVAIEVLLWTRLFGPCGVRGGVDFVALVGLGLVLNGQR